MSIINIDHSAPARVDIPDAKFEFDAREIVAKLTGIEAAVRSVSVDISPQINLPALSPRIILPQQPEVSIIPNNIINVSVDAKPIAKVLWFLSVVLLLNILLFNLENIKRMFPNLF